MTADTKLKAREAANALLACSDVDADLTEALANAFVSLLRAADSHAQRQAEAQAKAEGTDPDDLGGQSADPTGVVHVLIDEYSGKYIRKLVEKYIAEDDGDED